MGEITTIGVVGAGNMGSGIAQNLAQEGLNVVLLDTKAELVERGLGIIRSILEQGAKRGVFTEEKVGEILGRIKGTVDTGDLAEVDLVIEAVFEDQQVKKDLFSKLDPVCSERTVFATNTSSFYVSELAEATSRQDRFVGMHYFFPPAKNRLLEIIPHAGTSEATTQFALEVGRLHGKTNILVKDASGFCINRFFSPLLTEAVHVLSEGIANIATIEEAAKRAFEIGMGPFQLMNVTGIPIEVHASATFGRELGSLFGTPELLLRQMEKGENWDLAGEVDESKIAPIQDRLYGACLGAAAGLVDEGVASVVDTDLGARVGLRWKQGPFEIMNRLGIGEALRMVSAMSVRYPDFKTPEILKRQKESGKPFDVK